MSMFKSARPVSQELSVVDAELLHDNGFEADTEEPPIPTAAVTTTPARNTEQPPPTASELRPQSEQVAPPMISAEDARAAQELRDARASIRATGSAGQHFRLDTPGALLFSGPENDEPSILVPGSWSGDVVVDVHKAEQSVPPTLARMHARTTDGKSEWLADFESEQQAHELAERLRAIHAYASESDVEHAIRQSPQPLATDDARPAGVQSGTPANAIICADAPEPLNALTTYLSVEQFYDRIDSGTITGLEIEAVREANGSVQVVSPTDAPTFYSVYLRGAEGHAECIADFQDPIHARDFAGGLAEAFAQRVPGSTLPITGQLQGWLDDNTPEVVLDQANGLIRELNSANISGQFTALQKLNTFCAKSQRHAFAAWAAWDKNASQNVRETLAPIAVVAAALRSVELGASSAKSVAKAFATRPHLWDLHSPGRTGARIAFLNQFAIDRPKDDLAETVTSVLAGRPPVGLELAALESMWSHHRKGKPLPEFNGRPAASPQHATPVAANTTTESTAESGAEAPTQPPAKLQTLRQEPDKHGNICFLRIDDGKLCFVDRKVRIDVPDHKDAPSILAAVEHAKSKGWKTIKLSGDSEFIEAANRYAETLGMKVVGAPALNTIEPVDEASKTVSSRVAPTQHKSM